VLEIQKEIAPEERVCSNIGVTVQPVRDRSKVISVMNANRKNKELEQAARHQTREFNSIDNRVLNMCYNLHYLM